MSKEELVRKEFDARVKEVTELVRSLCDHEGVFSDTSLYGFLRSAEMSLSMAETRILEFKSEYVSDVVVSLSDGVILDHD